MSRLDSATEKHMTGRPFGQARESIVKCSRRDAP